MTFLINWLGRLLFDSLGYITNFFGWLFGVIIQYLTYGVTTIIEWMAYYAAMCFINILFYFDLFLQCVIYILGSAFGNDVFGIVGLSTSTIENNLTAILALIPFAKLWGYVLNIDAMIGAFQCFLTFLILWTAYRWFRVWVRG